jgi:hypothetical protein
MYLLRIPATGSIQHPLASFYCDPVAGKKILQSISHLLAAGLPVLKKKWESLGMPWKRKGTYQQLGGLVCLHKYLTTSIFSTYLIILYFHSFTFPWIKNLVELASSTRIILQRMYISCWWMRWETVRW